MASGELAAGTDVTLLMDQLTGAVFYRTFVSGTGLDDDDLRTVVTTTIDGHRVQRCP